MVESIKLCLVLFVFCLTSVVVAKADTCKHRPVGGYAFLRGHLIDSMGTFVDRNYSQYMKNTQALLQVSDLSSGRSFTIPQQIRALPVARNQHFSRILLRGYEGKAQAFFYLVDSQGKLLQTFSLPEDFFNPLQNDYYQIKINEEGTQVFFSSSKRILVFDLTQKKWWPIHQVQPGTTELGWFNSRTEMVNAIFYKDRVVFKQAVTQQESGVETFEFVVVRISDQQRLFQLSTSSYSSRLLEERYLVFDETGQIRVWDLETGRQQVIALPADLESDAADYFEGPLNSIGAVYARSNQVVLFSKEGRLLRRYHLKEIGDVVPIGGRRQLFFQDAQGLETFLLDTRTGQQTTWPSLLGAALNGTIRYQSKDKLYLNLYSDLNQQSQFLEIDLTLRCLTDEAANIELKKFSVSLTQGESILTLLGLEDKLVGADRQRLIQNFRKSLTQEKAMAYLGLILQSFDIEQKGSKSWRAYLKALSPALIHLPESQKEALLDTIAIKLGERIRRVPQLSDTPTSKLANIIVEILKPFFGVPSQGRTDFTLVQYGSMAVPVIFGTDPIDDDENTASPYGFYAKFLDPFLVEQDAMAPYQFQWKHRGQTWQAKGEARIVSLEKIINRSESIQHSNLWSDKKLVGAMVVSANILDNFEGLARKMLEYFKSEGFNFGFSKIKFPESGTNSWARLKNMYLFPYNSVSISDGKQWLREKIESGQLDYWVKEAHAGGNDEVIWLAKKNILLKGVKRLSQGRTEEIYLLFPESLDPFLGGREVPVSDQDFGDWMRQREKNRGKDLVYVNASCWSSHRAKQEIIAARSSLLHEIPTRASAWTFTNKENNHERLLVDMIRKGKSYSEMRARLDAIQDSPNPYIFPDEEVYDVSIWRGMHSALDFSVKVQTVP